jgi:murein DD-endopeptidase MepM/ murein hydrolase activator NlpD
LITFTLMNSEPKILTALIPSAKGFKPIKLSAEDPSISNLMFLNVEEATAEIEKFLQGKIGFGGYLEKRAVYQRSPHFGLDRNIHLGVDFFGAANTPIHLPFPGKIHSFAINNQPADYGPTIIVEHEGFYTLYGHLKSTDLDGLKIGSPINKGEIIGHFGDVAENGGWPPHLHFQVILNLNGAKGDFQGVCTASEVENMSKNCPNPLSFFENLI